MSSVQAKAGSQLNKMFFSSCFNQSTNNQEVAEFKKAANDSARFKKRALKTFGEMHQSFDEEKKRAAKDQLTSFTVDLYYRPGQESLVQTFVDEKVVLGWKADWVSNGHGARWKEYKFSLPQIN